MLAKLILIAVLPFLAACSTHSKAPASKPIVIAPKTAKVSSALKEPCSSPSEIPDGELSYADAIVQWSTDRASLEACKIRHKALADSISVLEQE